MARRRRLLIGLAVGLGALASYLLLWPVDIEPEAWDPPPPVPREGPWAPNAGFASASLLLEGHGRGPEGIAVDAEGRAYTGVEDGRIFRFSLEGGEPEVFATMEGRPLGMTFDRDGNLVVCDGHGGLVAFDRAGAARVLTDEVDGESIVFADDLAIGSDGVIWFSEASRRFPPGESAIDALEGQATGRLLRYDPVSEATSVELDGLRYANGVAVDPAGAFVLVAETFGYRITRLWLDGPKAGNADAFAPNLPGFPDNLHVGEDGTLWVALVKPRSAILDWAGPRPWARKMIVRLPEPMLPVPPPMGFIVAYRLDGHRLLQLQDESGIYGDVTSVLSVGDRLVLGSLTMPAVAILERPSPL